MSAAALKTKPAPQAEKFTEADLRKALRKLGRDIDDLESSRRPSNSAINVSRETRNRTGKCLSCGKPLKRPVRGRRRLFCLPCGVKRKSLTDRARYLRRRKAKSL